MLKHQRQERKTEELQIAEAIQEYIEAKRVVEGMQSDLDAREVQRQQTNESFKQGIKYTLEEEFKELDFQFAARSAQRKESLETAEKIEKEKFDAIMLSLQAAERKDQADLRAEKEAIKAKKKVRSSEMLNEQVDMNNAKYMRQKLDNTQILKKMFLLG